VTRLLKQSRERFPNAVLVLTGYYPILSDASSTAALVATGVGLLGPFGGGLVGGIGAAAIAEDVISNAVYLHRRQLHWLRRAVAEADADPAVRGPGVVFAHPGFDANNSLLTAGPFLFEPGDSDAQRAIRLAACEATDGGPTCQLAVIGHPNTAGALAYADVVEARTRSHLHCSLREDLVPLAAGGSPTSVRSALERYGLSPSTGLRAALNHTVVDSIEVTVWTGENGTDSNVSIAVNGTDSWPLDTAWLDDFEAGSRHVFTIDPRMEGRATPLELAEIDRVRIEKDGAFEWMLDRVRVRLNGRTVLDENPAVSLSGDDAWLANYPH